MEFYISPQSGQFYMINVLGNQWLSVTGRHIATVLILEPFFGRGGAKSILFSLFWNKKASSKYIYTLNGVHI